MNASNLKRKLDTVYLNVRENRWHRYFYIFCRISLAYAFIVAGMVKIVGERFASGLPVNNPMGGYLEALHHTAYYYTWIGIAQVLAAIMLLIPRTVIIGALLYLPIILNIFILSAALRFEGSIVTAPLMVLANLYILAWNYDRLKFILPFKKMEAQDIIEKPTKYRNKFPFLFFLAVFCTMVLTVVITEFTMGVMPRNSKSDCHQQFVDTPNEEAGFRFCSCIHDEGNPLSTCLDAFKKAKK